MPIPSMPLKPTLRQWLDNQEAQVDEKIKLGRKGLIPINEAFAYSGMKVILATVRIIADRDGL